MRSGSGALSTTGTSLLVDKAPLPLRKLLKGENQSKVKKTWKETNQPKLYKCVRSNAKRTLETALKGITTGMPD